MWMKKRSVHGHLKVPESVDLVVQDHHEAHQAGLRREVVCHQAVHPFVAFSFSKLMVGSAQQRM